MRTARVAGKMLYLDTSAFLKLYVAEEGSVTVQKALNQSDEPLPLSELLEMEFTNALQLKVFWGDLDSQQASAQMNHFDRRKKRGLYYYPEVHRSELMAQFREFSKATPDLGCRTMDILHLAYARLFEADCFVTFDQRQRTLAQQVGFNLLETD